MLDQYQEVLSIYEAAEILGTGKNRIYELVNSEISLCTGFYHMGKPQESSSINFIFLS